MSESNASRWSAVSALLSEALELDEASRAAFLDERCAGDPELRAEVQSLLDAHQASGGFMDVPAPVAAGLTPAPPSQPSLVNLEQTDLGPYHIDREISRGGMGVVYLAEDTRLGREVAIKVLPPEHAADAERRARMRVEARAAGRLTHPGIATVYALEEHDGHLCLVCEFVHGHTLRAEIERGPLDLPTLVDTALQLARALAAAHASGVVHRDLKPENVMRADTGAVKILDFGVARFVTVTPGGPALTREGLVVGTPGYMSPEQLEGRETDARSDIFSFGVLLFELATGTHPFETRTPAATAAAVIAGEPPDLMQLNPALPAALSAVISRCLEKNPDDRYPSAAAIVRDLEPLRTSSGTMRRTPVRVNPSSRWWWVMHQVTAMVVMAAMIPPVWWMAETIANDLTRALLLATIATVVVNGTIRAHLLFTYRFNRKAIGAQVRRSQRLLLVADWAFAIVLVTCGFGVRTHVGHAALLAGVGLAWAVSAQLIEPATREAAFPS